MFGDHQFLFVIALLRQLTDGTCPSGKVRYPDGERAQTALELIRLTRDLQPWRRERRGYFCPKCRGIHLTSRPLGERPRTGSIPLALPPADPQGKPPTSDLARHHRLPRGERGRRWA